MELPGNMYGGIFMIPGQQDRSHAGRFELIYGRGCIFAQCVSQRDKTGTDTVNGKADYCTPLFQMHFAFIDDFIRQRNVIVPEQPGIACKYGPSVDHCLHAPSGQHLELVGREGEISGF